MSYLIENIKKSKLAQSELVKTIEAIEEGLETAKSIIDRAESVGLELKYEMPDLAMWAKGAMDCGFDDHESDEAEIMSSLVDDIYEYANQIEYIFSEEYQKNSKLYQIILDI